jgi:glycerol uptake facilitator protein
MIQIFLGELIGTCLMILLGNGVVANVLLKKSKGVQGGWIVTSMGWGLAVSVSVYLVGWISGAHLNPAVTLAFALFELTSWSLVPIYFIGQMIGAILGAFFVWIVYRLHFQETEDAHLKLLCFSTVPAIRSIRWNFLTEMIATAVLILGIFGMISPKNELSAGLAPYLIGSLVLAIGLSLGGPTGYAINPARDLGPRLVYTCIYGKSHADWSYAWIPCFAPFLGSYIGYVIYQLLVSFSLSSI